MKILTLQSRGLIPFAMVMLLVGSVYAQSNNAESDSSRIEILEKALMELAEKNAQLASEVMELKKQITTNKPKEATSSVLDDGKVGSQPIASTGGASSVPAEIPDDQITFNWDNGIEFTTKDGTANGEFGGRFHWDLGGYDADEDAEAIAGGDINGGSQFRRLRISSEGEFGWAEPIIYKVDVDIAGGTPVLKDTYVGFKDLPYVGELRLGHIKEPFSMEEMGSSKHMGFIERATLNEALVPSRNNGFQIANTAFDDRMGWQVGGFVNVPNDNVNEMDGNYRGTGRFLVNF